MRKFRNKETGIILVPNNKMVIDQLSKSELYEEIKTKDSKETTKKTKDSKETDKTGENEE